MNKSDLTYIPKSDWKKAEVQPASGSVKEKLQILYILLIPAVIIALGSLTFPINLRLYVQIVDTVFVLILTLLSIFLTVKGYRLQKKEEVLGYTTWSESKTRKQK